jgi:hypothetical protein
MMVIMMVVVMIAGSLGRLGSVCRHRVGLPRRDDPDPVLGQCRTEVLFDAAREALPLADDELADRVDLLGRAHAVGCANVQAGLELIVEIRDPDHVELVEVRLPDRAELDALHERNRRILGELQDPVVEVEPGELAIEVEGRVLEVEGAWRPLRRYRFDGLSSG